eukprot:SAG31_NODE_525_length_14489_cov_3.693815_1_plen_51_part_00
MYFQVRIYTISKFSRSMTAVRVPNLFSTKFSRLDGVEDDDVNLDTYDVLT